LFRQTIDSVAIHNLKKIPSAILQGLRRFFLAMLRDSEASGQESARRKDSDEDDEWAGCGLHVVGWGDAGGKLTVPSSDA
jgi:hypothetical protein